jgi:hypothetical protein
VAKTDADPTPQFLSPEAAIERVARAAGSLGQARHMLLEALRAERVRSWKSADGNPAMQMPGSSWDELVLEPNGEVHAQGWPVAGHLEFFLAEADVQRLAAELGSYEGRKRGPKPKFDPDKLVAEVIRRVYQDGIPDSNEKFAKSLHGWCRQQVGPDNEIPSIRRLRHLAGMWLKALREDGD